MFFLAIRHLFSRKKQTLLTLLGIVLGTAAYISITGMMLGFQTFMINQLVNNDSHIRIQAKEKVLTHDSLNTAFFSENELFSWVKAPSGRKDNAYILNPQQWLNRLAKDEKVLAASPQLVAQAIASFGKQTLGVSVIGTYPDKQKKVSNIESMMVIGKFSDIGTSGNRISVGNGFLKKLGASVGETILLTVGKGISQPFKVVSVFHVGIKNIDEKRVFAALKDVQQLNLTPSRISDIAIRLIDVNSAREIALSYSLFGEEQVQSWDQANEGTMSVITTQNIISNMMTISILIVAGFGIYNVLSLAVTHKRREISILRSMGFEPWDITKLFLIQGIILGVLGGIIGLILGLLVSYYMSTIEVSGDRRLGGDRMIISYHFMIYVKAFILAFISSSLASFFPARAAGRLEPIDIIRGKN